MDIKVDPTKTKKMVHTANSTEKFSVIIGSEHQVDDTRYVVAQREGKKGYVRVAAASLKEVK